MYHHMLRHASLPDQYQLAGFTRAGLDELSLTWGMKDSRYFEGENLWQQPVKVFTKYLDMMKTKLVDNYEMLEGLPKSIKGHLVNVAYICE